ncbi:MAG: thioredoxin family protein [Methanomicrobiaceae archaeon]|nr:thioredoxin family protein [Methanomicrobiaceae archaeon]
MAVNVICFYQEGCMGCEEQEPINREVESALGIRIEAIDAVRNQQYISEYNLRVTPTILVLVDGEVKERFEGLVHREELEAAIKKYL